MHIIETVLWIIMIKMNSSLHSGEMPQIQWQSQKRGPFKHKKTFNRQQYNVLLEIVDNYQ